MLCCPICKEGLKKIGNNFRCQKCNRKYPIFFDIPDFRIIPDPYLTFAEDKKIARAIHQAKKLNYS